MGIVKSFKKLGLFTKIMIGFALGIIAGIIMREDASMFAFLGTILTNLLKMVVAPLVLCVLVVAVADMKDGKRVGRIGIKAIVTFIITTLGAIALGLLIANAMNEWKLLSYSDIQLFDYCMRHDDMPHIEPHIDYLLRIFRNVGKYESAKVANKFCLKSLEENLKIQNDK